MPRERRGWLRFWVVGVLRCGVEERFEAILDRFSGFPSWVLIGGSLFWIADVSIVGRSAFWTTVQIFTFCVQVLYVILCWLWRSSVVSRHHGHVWYEARTAAEFDSFDFCDLFDSVQLYEQRFFLLQYRTVRMIPGTGTVQVPYHQKVLVLYSTVQVQYAPGIIRSYCTVTGIRRSVQTAPGRVSKRETHRTLNSDGWIDSIDRRHNNVHFFVLAVFFQWNEHSQNNRGIT